MLADVCGYDKYHEVTGQYAIRGTFVDLAVKVDENIRFLIEVKAVGIELNDIHIRLDYAANEGIEWVILTNGAVWRVYNVHFGQPIEKILVCEVDLTALSPKSDEILECFGNLSREGFCKKKMTDWLHQKQLTSKFTVATKMKSQSFRVNQREHTQCPFGLPQARGSCVLRPGDDCIREALMVSELKNALAMEVGFIASFRN